MGNNITRNSSVPPLFPSILPRILEQGSRVSEGVFGGNDASCDLDKDVISESSSLPTVGGVEPLYLLLY